MKPYEVGQRVRIKQTSSKAYQHLVGELGTVVSVFPPGDWGMHPDTKKKYQTNGYSYHLDLDHGPMMDTDGQRRVKAGHATLEPIDDEERDVLAQVTQILDRLKAVA